MLPSKPSLLSRGALKLRKVLHLKRIGTDGYEPLASSPRSPEGAQDATDGPLLPPFDSASCALCAELERDFYVPVIASPSSSASSPTTSNDTEATPPSARSPTLTPRTRRRNTYPSSSHDLTTSAIPNQHENTDTLSHLLHPPPPRSQPLDILATELQGNRHHIAHLTTQLRAAQADAASLRGHIRSDDDYISQLLDRTRGQTALIDSLWADLRGFARKIKELQADRRKHARTIHRFTNQQTFLCAEMRELQRQRERSRDALKAVRARTWVLGWALKAKIAELGLKLDGAVARLRIKEEEVRGLETRLGRRCRMRMRMRVKAAWIGGGG